MEYIIIKDSTICIDFIKSVRVGAVPQSSISKRHWPALVSPCNNTKKKYRLP